MDKFIYLDKDGEEKFTVEKNTFDDGGEKKVLKTPVLPMDKIIFFKCIFKTTDTQENRLKELKKQHTIAREIRRKGDENIIVELKEKLININTEGLVLEFNKVNAIYSDDEVIKNNIVNETFEVGDKVIAIYAGKEIEGVIHYKYNNQDAFNITWDGKHSAFHRSLLIKKVV